MPWLRQYNPRIDWRKGTISLDQSAQNVAPVKSLQFVPANNPDIAMIDSDTFCKLESVSPECAGTLYYAECNALQGATSAPHAQDIPDSRDYADKLKELVPDQYHETLTAFSKRKADSLPPHRPYDLSIDLEPGKTPPFGPIYSLSEVELKALSEWLEDNLSKGFIRASASPAGAPILFVKKKTGELTARSIISPSKIDIRSL